MGTRALILLQGHDSELYDVGLYKHWDGYIEGVLPVLGAIVREFYERRGHEPDLLLANIVQDFKNQQDKGLKLRDILGYRLELLESLECYEDIEHTYYVTDKGAILHCHGNGLSKVAGKISAVNCLKGKYISEPILKGVI